ncbi:MAG TPA: hypothetical protein VFN91_07355 [Myxococcaceae bacterium]|nr:hypothetical protein [Myxococcaceae bacterium]
MTLVPTPVDAPDRVGVCLESCQLFAAGYELSSGAGTEPVMNEAGAAGLPALPSLVNDERFRLTPAVLDSPDPGRYASWLRLLHSLIRK